MKKTISVIEGHEPYIDSTIHSLSYGHSLGELDADHPWETIPSSWKEIIFIKDSY